MLSNEVTDLRVNGRLQHPLSSLTNDLVQWTPRLEARSKLKNLRIQRFTSLQNGVEPT